ncbi:MAG: peptide ABC transporter substrate-binding protein, partial [Cyanobacteria bacterium]|nr:peptide ABC transporter substrate-binding protein [Cyanobacteriota bacterium]
LHYVFHLRHNAQWSDGKPVTAQHFVDGWRRGLTPANGSEYVSFLFEIKNAKAFYDGKLKDFQQVGVHALGPSVLKVDLERPIPYFLSLVASAVAYPARLDNIQRDGEQFTEAGKFITNGPYLLNSWKHEDRMGLVPNPLYYGSKPKVDFVEFLMVNDANTSVVMYENNELDYIESPSSISSFDIRRLKTHPDYHSGILFGMFYLGFNTTAKPFDNPKVRQAFGYALDRTYFPKLLQSGQQTTLSWIPPHLFGYNPKIGLPFNPVKAKKLLEEAGYPDGKNFPPVELSFRTMYDIQKEAEIAQYQWKKNLNVSVTLRNMEWKVYLKRLGEQKDPVQLYRLSWFADFPDPDTFMSLFTKNNGNNKSRWKSHQYDEWIQEASVERNPKQRQQLYDKAQELLIEQEAVILPLYVGRKSYLVKPYVHGLTVNPLNLIDLDGLDIQPH